MRHRRCFEFINRWRQQSETNQGRYTLFCVWYIRPLRAGDEGQDHHRGGRCLAVAGLPDRRISHSGGAWHLAVDTHRRIHHSGGDHPIHLCSRAAPPTPQRLCLCCIRRNFRVEKCDYNFVYYVRFIKFSWFVFEWLLDRHLFVEWQIILLLIIIFD